MLERKDFISVESRYKRILKNIKSQLTKGEISFEDACYKTKVELLNLKRRLPLLCIMLPKEEYANLEKLEKQYENFIELTKPLSSSV